ncbi:hypothetical protein IKO50_06465 [bacterium]|nr:hypothetical protein [bacterium]
MKTIKKLLSAALLSLFGMINLFPIFNITSAQTPYDQVLGITVADADL